MNWRLRGGLIWRLTLTAELPRPWHSHGGGTLATSSSYEGNIATSG